METDAWLRQSEADLKAARDNVDTENYHVAAFLAHQSAEKALKAVYISKKQDLWKTHDLVALARAVGAPVDVVDRCDRLNPHYIATRYPVGSETVYEKEDVENAISDAREVLGWARKQL